MTRANTRLPGHVLWHEGDPVTGTGDGSWLSGRGECSCHDRSPVLTSNRARQEWHRAHKDELRARYATKNDETRP